jgi:hypothetical protein
VRDGFTGTSWREGRDIAVVPARIVAFLATMV